MSGAPVVIKAHELNAMKRRAFTGRLVIGGDPVAAEMAATKKASRKKASAERAATWGNTLLAQRKKKEEARLRREEEAEAARQVIDREEAELAARERLAVIRRANQLLVSQTERMKMLKSEQMNSDIMDVRARQIAHKARKADMMKEREAEYARLLEEQLREQDAKEAAEAEARALKVAETAKMQQEQKDAFVAKYIAEMKAEREEGDRIRARAIADEEEDRRKAADRVAEARLRNMEMKRANETMQRLRDEEARRAEEEEKIHQKYALQKDAERARREDFVEYKRQEHETRMTKMRDTMERDFMSRMADEGARVEAQVAEADAKKAAAEAAAAERRRQMAIACDKSRKAQLARKAAARDAEAREKVRFTKQWGSIQKELEDEEAADTADRRRKALELQSFLLKQARAKEEMEQAGVRTTLEEERAARARADAGDADFQRMAEDLISEEIKRGHNPVRAARMVHRSKGEKLIPANAVF